MKQIKSCFLIVFPLIAALLSASCTTGIRLNTTGDGGPQTSGSFRVIFFGCNYLNDLETIAFLDKEGDQYTFEPYAPDFKYRTEKGVTAKDALEKAQKFLNCNAALVHTRMSAINAPNGDVIGYEIRPAYENLAYGAGRALYTDYWLRDNKVIISIRLSPDIERMLRDGNGAGITK